MDATKLGEGLLFGALLARSIWSLVRGFRTGAIPGLRSLGADRTKSPGRFYLLVVSHGLIVVVTGRLLVYALLGV